VSDEVLTIPGTETDAAARKVPIPTAVRNMLDRLIRESIDGYLIPSTTDNQHDERSAAIGKRFGRMNTRLGPVRGSTASATRYRPSWRTHSAPRGSRGHRGPRENHYDVWSLFGRIEHGHPPRMAGEGGAIQSDVGVSREIST
jgi:hypothetical protein